VRVMLVRAPRNHVWEGGRVTHVTTLQSIGSTMAPAGESKPGGAGILRSQLSRYEKQLSDWCNCPSGKTLEGKKKIAAIQQQADAVKVQIRKIDDSRAAQGALAVPAAADARPVQDRRSTAAEVRLDVYA
jgi:hypothetical protein